MDLVQAAEQRIRDIVNDPRRRHGLLQKRQEWLRLCSAMDAIGDTQEAVRAYLDEPVDKDESKGRSYINVYGILQVLYVQQDAAKTLASCLNLTLDWPDELDPIRETRNDSIGHPTGRGNFISRISLSSEGFQLLVPAEKGKREFRSVRIRAVVEKQIEVMGRLLERAVEQLVADELAHRKQFRDNPLRGAIPGNVGYALEKIGSGLHDPSERPMGFYGTDVVRGAVTKLRQMLAERGLTEAYKDSIGDTLAQVEYAVDRIESRLKGGNTHWNERDDEVYWFFLGQKVNYLKELAAEIDREYESDEVQ